MPLQSPWINTSSTTTGDCQVGPGSFFSHRMSPVCWSTAKKRPWLVAAYTTPFQMAGVPQMP